MEPKKILEIIISSSSTLFTFKDDISIEIRGYDGIVAKAVRNENNKGKPKIGLFDFKIYHHGVPPKHIDILNTCIRIGITKDDLDYIYNGGDPWTYENPKRELLQIIQLLFLEQEINYGNEDFQAYKVMLLARNYFMVYLFKLVTVSSDKVNEYIKSIPIDENGKIYKPPNEADQHTYITKRLPAIAWLSDDILKKYKQKSQLSPNNPNWIDDTPIISSNINNKKIKLLITDLDYIIEQGTGILLARCFGRDDQGNRQIILIEGTRPFFGIHADEPVPMDPRITGVEEGQSDLKGNPLKRIFVRYPKDVAKRIKCTKCNGDQSIECDCINGQIETGLRAGFKTTFQADVVYSQILRIYYGLNGTIEVPSNRCHISQVKKSTTKISPRIGVLDIETIDSVDTLKAPEPIPCFTLYDDFTDTYHVFCYGFKKYELAQVPVRIQQHWLSNLIPKLQKYNFQNPKIQFHAWDLETQMLGDLINFSRNLAPDMFATWNGTFDLPYIVQRMKNLSIPYQGLSETGKVYYNQKEEVVRIEGKSELDLMYAYAGIQPRDLISKSLDYCSNKELGIGKMKRVSIKEMRQKDPVGLLAYNIVDVQISYAMMQECQIYSQQQTLSEIANIGLDNQSPLRITESFIMSYVKDRKILLPTTIHEKRDGKKEGGAFVHDVTIGIHKNVVILDFKGYYTSMMMSGNMCASTFVTRDEIRQALIGKTYGEHTFVREEDITEIILDEIINKFYVHTPNCAIFRKDKKGVIPEILVHVRDQRNYHKKLMREETDPQKKNIEDLIQNGFKRIGNIFYGQFKNPHFRLMQKEIAEAVTSACKSLTLRTINTIEHLNVSDILIKYRQETQLSETEFDTLLHKINKFLLSIKYGDSVVKDTTILIKDQENNIHFAKIEEIFTTVDYTNGTKEYSIPQGLQTLTIKDGKSVWKPIKYVMRHKTDKQIKKVSISNQWNVSVTEDHSLIGYLNVNVARKNNGKNIIEVKPSELGTKCKTIITLKKIPRINISSKNYPKELYHFMGLFIGNGCYHTKFGEKNYYLSLSNGIEKKEDVMKKVIVPLQEKCYIKNYWQKSKIFDIEMNGLTLCRLMEDFRNVNGKIIPQWMFNETEENISYFISGLFDSDGSIGKRGNGYIITYTSINECLIRDIQRLLWFIGIPSGICKENTVNCYNGKCSGTYSIRLNIRDNFIFKQKIQYITEKKQKAIDNVHGSATKTFASANEFDTAKVYVDNIDYNDYVYDIEVEDTHTFFANGFLVHNTDSLFVKLPDSLNAKEMDIVGKTLEKHINSTIPSVVKELFNIDKETCYTEIEHDDKKAMKAMIQMPARGKDVGAKKRYIYLSYNKDGTVDPNPHFVGVEAVRSDTSPMVVEVQTQLSKLILNDRPYPEVRTYLLNIHKNFKKTDPHQLLIKETIHAFDNAKSHSPQLIGALYANKYMSKSFKSGTSVYYIYLKSMPKGYPAHVQTKNWGNQKCVVLCLNYNEIIPSQFMAHIDFDKMRELVLENPAEGIIAAIGYSWSNILSGMSENKITPISTNTLSKRQSLMEI